MATSAFRWWHGVLLMMIANVASALPAGYNGDEAFYNDFRSPGVAPPGWAFAPVWFVLNATSIMALSIVANSPERSARRTAFLNAQGWKVLRFWNAQVLTGIDDVLREILAHLSGE